MKFAKFVRTPFFEEHHWTTASDSTSINSSEGRISKQNRELLKKAVQVKEQFSGFRNRFAYFKLGVLKNFVSFTRKHR